ncbi:MAG: cytochrome P450 [Microbacteriaceae bacterium]
MTDIPEFPAIRDPEHPLDPPPALLRLRDEEGPVARVKLWNGSMPWLVTGYDELRELLVSPHVSVDTEKPGYPHFNAGMAARQHRIRTFINMDEPEHGVQRRLLAPDFTPKRMESMRPFVQQVADGLIDAMLAGPPHADLVTAFALPLPSLVICELLGVPYDDREFFQDVSTTLLSRVSTPAEAVAVTDTLVGYLVDLVGRKDEQPDDSLLSRLAVEQMRTGRMSREEVAALGELLLVAGHETTANQIALSTIALLQHPDQLAEIRDGADPRVVGNAIEELLRYLSIIHFGRRRVAMADFEIGGQLIRAGEGVIGANDIGNRDDTAFPDPHRLDIHRKARHHNAFGHGIHQCIGQQLARIELEVVYTTLFRRIPTLALAQPVTELKFKHDGVVYGVHELPVVW